MSTRRLLGTIVLLSCLFTSVAPAAEPGVPRNALKDSQSPYLLLHADDPVDWHPWGAAAFAKARAQDKPIFLSVGYSTCYWCHVAEQTLYSDPEIAALMNRWFINVKVDREQLPDVDETYMVARRILADGGGWPNNVFMTSDLKPFFAGSYFPATPDQSGRPTFSEVLASIASGWRDRREGVLELAEMAHERMTNLARRLERGDGAVTSRPRDWLRATAADFVNGFDIDNGGRFLGGGVKFPQSPMLRLLLTAHRVNEDGMALNALSGTLAMMAHGGIRDHLAGGFHRYTVERSWSIPHFEKMLYDNAQLLALYSAAHAETGAPLYRDVAREIARYMLTRMQDPDGGFYTAEDAQIDGVEGASYLWTRAEIDAVLGPEDTERLLERYVLVAMPKIPVGPREGHIDGVGVLRLRPPRGGALLVGSNKALEDPISGSAAALRPLLDRLLADRDRREQPLRDEKLVVALNGLAIEGLASAGRALSRPDYIDAAARAGDRIWRDAFDPASGNLRRQIFRGHVTLEAYLEDYALLGLGFMELFAATGETLWRQRAEGLAIAMRARFQKPDGRFTMGTGTTGLPVFVDGAGDRDHPSGASAAVALLSRLGEESTAERHLAPLRRFLDRMGPRLQENPESWATAVSALSASSQQDLITVAASLPASDAAPPRARLPETSDHVSAAARRRGDRLEVTLEIDDGFHVNANPASLPFLIPTTVTIVGADAGDVRYPAAESYRPAFANETIAVYKGDVTLVLPIPDGAADGVTDISVRAQACNDQICLPPSDIRAVFSALAPRR